MLPCLPFTGLELVEPQHLFALLDAMFYEKTLRLHVSDCLFGVLNQVAHLAGVVDSLAGLGLPSLARCESLAVTGEVRFEDGVVIDGAASFGAEGEATVVPAGRYP